MGLIPRRTTYKFEYLREFEPEFEIVLGSESGAHMGPIHEKNQRPKISCYCTFKCVPERGGDKGGGVMFGGRRQRDGGRRRDWECRGRCRENEERGMEEGDEVGQEMRRRRWWGAKEDFF